MNFYLSALIAIVIFFVTASLTLDAATAFLGRPSRGVSYGIGIYYLNLALAIVGSITLVSTKWLRRNLSMGFGTVGVCVCVITFFPQPDFVVRVLVALTISVMLATAVAFHWKIARLR